MKKIKYILSIVAFLQVLSFPAAAKIRVVTTSEDLASIARSIGGSLVQTESLTSGNTDLHYAQARPDYIVKLNRADVFIQVGLELEVGWVPILLRQARNAKIIRGAPGYCITWRGVPLKGKPAGLITRQMGDIHPRGNPHYWTDPVNGIIIGRNIRDTLIRVDPANTARYRRNFKKFRGEVTLLTKKLLEAIKPFRGRKVAVYHSEFNYLLSRFGLRQEVMLEELPGISPSPSHLRKVTAKIRREKIRVILATPWSNLSFAGKIARDSGAQLVILPIQTGSTRSTGTYQAMLTGCVHLLRIGLQ